MKKMIIAGLVIFLGGFGYVIYFMFNSTHMRVQPSIQAYQMEMPLPPANAVSTTPPKPLPTQNEALKLQNPLPPTVQNLSYGRVYYEYYCTFCHGPAGNGYGPVGLSYVPLPSDLGSQRIQSMPDGQLMRSMLTGPGHGPVLERIIPPDFRWYLVLYVKTLPNTQQ